MLNDNDLVTGVVDQICDDHPVDWRDVTTKSTNPDERRVIHALQAIEKIMHAQRTPPVEDAATPEGRTSVEWKHLRILEKVGEGTSAEVFRARDDALERDVALKLFKASSLHLDVHKDRYLNEGQLLARFKHSNIVTVYGAAEDQGRVGIWMEFLDGKTLDAVVREGTLSPREASVIGIDLCRALAGMHAQHIVHLDVKATNVMRENGGRIVLMDFSTSRAGAGSSGGSSGQAGTPLYMAPELFAGASSSRACDIYSVGVLLFYLVSGDYPVAGLSVPEIAEKHQKRQPRHLRDIRPDVSEEFARVVEKAIHPTPDCRHASAGELGNELSRALERPDPTDALSHEPIRAIRTASPTRKRLPSVFAAVSVALALVATILLLGEEEVVGIPRGSKIVLGQVHNLTQDVELDPIGDVFRNQLAQSPDYELVSEADIRNALVRMRRDEIEPINRETAAEIAWRDDAEAIVMASLSGMGTRYRLSVALEGVGDEPTESSFRFHENFDAESKEAILDAVDDSNAWLWERLGATDDGLSDSYVPARQATSSSWQALSLYTQSFEQMERGDRDAAIAALESAIAIDSEFARARARLGSIIGWTDLGQSFAHWRRAVETANQVRLTQKESLSIETLIANGEQDSERALALFDRWATLYPYDEIAVVGKALTLRDLGRPSDAIASLEGLKERSPGNPFAISRLAELYLESDELTRARELLARLRSLRPDEAQWVAVADSYEARILFAEGRYEESLDSFANVQSSSSAYWGSRGHLMTASMQAELGRFSEARKTLEDGLEFDSRSQDFAGLGARKFLALAQLDLMSGDIQALQSSVSSALSLSQDPQLVARAGALLARAGRHEDAFGLVGVLTSDGQSPVYEVARLRIEGEVALARGAIEQAVEVLEEAGRVGLQSSEREYLARARKAAGDLRGALEAYRFTAGRPGRRGEFAWELRPGFITECLEEIVDISRKLALEEEERWASERLAGLRAKAQSQRLAP